MTIQVELNGEETRLDVDESTLLIDALREEGCLGVKQGCQSGECGSCNVLVDGDVVQTCVTRAGAVEGRAVETIEGLGTQDDLHPLQRAFVERNATQCGFCVPGTIMSAKALLAETPDPSEAEVRSAIGGNLCRCTGYEKQVDAILAAADRMGDGGVAADGGVPADVGGVPVDDSSVPADDGPATEEEEVGEVADDE